MIKFSLNDENYRFEGDPKTPLLWVLRDSAGLKGTRFGCGAGLCGACTVHVDGRARRACITPVDAVEDRRVVTIEGLGADRLHPVQQAWLEEDVPQCGYCQAGQIMTAADWLSRIPNPGDADIEKFQTNLCRCGTYARIRKAIYRSAELQREAAAVSVEPAAGAGDGEELA